MNFNKNVVFISLLAIFITSFFLMLFSSFRDSQTTDEAIHLSAGYSYLTKRDFRLDPEHPPFLKELAAVPLLLTKTNTDFNNALWDKAGNFYYDSWYETRVLGERFFYSLGNNPEKLLFLGRLPFIILTLILGLVAFIWARKLYGIKSGIFAAFLVLFFPNILAHGRLINTDLGLTLFIFLTVFLWGEYLKKLKLSYLLLCGLALGLALASKFTGLIILPILFILFIVKALFFDQKKNLVFKYLLSFIIILLVSFVVVWASYGFIIKTPSVVPTGFIDQILWRNHLITSDLATFLNNIRVFLFPAELYKGIYLVFRHAVNGHGSYLLGQSSTSGWWYYFPVAIFYKTPIPVFIFLGLSLIFYKKIRAKETFDEVLLILPPLVFLIFSMFSKADLGIRHILPIFPFLLIFASKSINLVNFEKQMPKGKSKIFKEKIVPVLFLGLILWYLVGTIISYPNYLAYFNEFAGGSKNGYKYLADSNLDWGQDIYRLKTYLNEHNINQIYIVYPWDGDAALTNAGINFVPLYPEDRNVKGKVVVSATYYETDAYAWLKNYAFSQITPGLFIFNIN